MELEYSDEAAAFVALVSGGHPFLARQLCSAAFEDLGESATGEITLAQLQDAAERFISDPDTASLLNENGLWGEVTSPELWPVAQITENQAVLTNLAATDTQPEAALVATAKDRAARQQSIFELKQRAVLSRLEELLRIQFGLFQNWIKRYQA
jgi:hypothetical protein